MKNDGAYIFLTHSLVRAMLLGRPVSDAYLGIFKSIFPGAVRGRYVGAVDTANFQQIHPAALLQILDPLKRHTRPFVLTSPTVSG